MFRVAGPPQDCLSHYEVTLNDPWRPSLKRQPFSGVEKRNIRVQLVAKRMSRKPRRRTVHLLSRLMKSRGNAVVFPEHTAVAYACCCEIRYAHSSYASLVATRMSRPVSAHSKKFSLSLNFRPRRLHASIPRVFTTTQSSASHTYSLALPSSR